MGQGLFFPQPKIGHPRGADMSPNFRRPAEELKKVCRFIPQSGIAEIGYMIREIRIDLQLCMAKGTSQLTHRSNTPGLYLTETGKGYGEHDSGDHGCQQKDHFTLRLPHQSNKILSEVLKISSLDSYLRILFNTAQRQSQV